MCTVTPLRFYFKSGLNFLIFNLHVVSKGVDLYPVTLMRNIDSSFKGKKNNDTEVSVIRQSHQIGSIVARLDIMSNTSL